MGERNKKWYVVKTVAGKEKKAKEYIESEIRRLNCEDLVGDILIPVEKVFSVRNGKKVSKEKTLFSGYLFIEARLEGELAHAITNSPNVLDFIKQKDGKPIPMQDNEVERILKTVDNNIDNGEVSAETFMVGETVKIIDGPFKNFDGDIEEVDNEKQKLKVTVKIFGRKTPVELSNYQVEK